MGSLQTEKTTEVLCSISWQLPYNHGVRFVLNSSKDSAFAKETWYHWKASVCGAQHMGFFEASLIHWPPTESKAEIQEGSLSRDFWPYGQEQIYDDFIVKVVKWSQNRLTSLKEELKFTFFAEFKFTHQIKENIYGQNLLKIVRGRSKEKEVELFPQEIKLERNRMELSTRLL